MYDVTILLFIYGLFTCSHAVSGLLCNSWICNDLAIVYVDSYNSYRFSDIESYH